MSRHLQTALAGPSTFRQAVTPRASAAPRFSAAVSVTQGSQTRSASFDRFLPSFLKRDSAGSPEASSSGGSQDAAAASSVVEGETASTGLFDNIAKQAEQEKRVRKLQQGKKQLDVRSPEHKISFRKLNDLSRQIADLPVGEAIVQMQFSEKRASKWIQPLLVKAREDAVKKGMNQDKLVVAETWVGKGSRLRRLDIKGRGRAGIKNHNYTKLYLRLREGKTLEEKEAKKFARELELVRGAGIVREDGVIRRKVISGWTW